MHKWQDQMFHEFMHSIGLFAFEKSKNPKQKCAINIWGFQPRTIGQGGWSRLSLCFIFSKASKTETKNSLFPGTVKDFLQPQTLTAL